MKHFEKKFALGGSKGGGGSTPPKPPTLKPPIIGSYKVGASFQFSETIDLLCDGPIHGLCNKYGVKLNNKDLLQGVFLNNVPIQEPIKSIGQIRVLNNQSYESAGTNLFKSNMNYLFNELIGQSEALEEQKSINTDTFIDPPEKNCIKESTYKSRWFVNREKPIYCPALMKKARRFRISRYKKSGDEVIALDDEFYNASIQTSARYKESNELQDSGITFGKNIPISYFSKATVAREYSVPFNTRDYRFRKYGDTTYGKEYYIAGGQSAFSELYTQVEGSVAYLGYSKKTLPWRSYVNKEVDLYNTSKDYFFNKKGISHINENGDMNSSLRLELGQSIHSIRDYIFRGYSSLWQDNSCSYPYNINNCTTDSGQDAVGTCSQGTFDLISIVENKDQNKYEYEFLKKQFESLGWAIPSTMSKEWMISKFELEFGTNSQLLESIKNSSERKFANPFLAFRFVESYIMEGFGPSHANTFVDSFDNVNPIEFDMLSTKDLKTTRFSANFLIPNLDPATGEWDGKVKGFYYSPLEIEQQSKTDKLITNGRKGQALKHVVVQRIDVLATAIKKREYDYLNNVFGIALFQNKYKKQGQEVSKYNFSNVLCEFRNGSGPNDQTPLSYFKDVYLEHSLDRKLIGPFNTNSGRRTQSLINWTVNGIYKYDNGAHKQRSLRIGDKESVSYSSTTYVKFLKGLVLESGGYTEGITVRNVPYDNQVPDMVKNWTVAVSEGSLDKRPDGTKKFDFSGWNSYKKNFDERAQPVTHIVTNPNCEKFFFQIIIESLYDTLHRDASKTSGDDLGKKIPSMVNLRIEVGYVEPNTSIGDGFKLVYDRFFRIASLVEQRAPLDIGNPDNKNALLELDYVEELYKDTSGSESNYKGGLATPFDLPSALISDEIGQENTFRDRYIKITKLSTESNSTLIFKTLKMAKVVEIIPSNMNYPYSAIVGTKIDSRTFEQIPTRSFEARLKQIKIPSNYYPLRSDGTDRRFWDKAEDWRVSSGSDDVLIYDGDWDGQFKIGWTDNPAWIIYDLLTSTRYGLGEFIQPEEINKWQLYKIARFCDAVDKDGYFVGVDAKQYSEGSALGLREPRYTCNMMFTSSLKAYDALNMVSSIFKGMVYYNNSSVSFSDDTIKEPVLLFNNNNVENGFFDYSSYTRDKQYNAIEVSYLDREDNYRNKIEYIEDEEDVARRGLFKKTADAYGTTSKAQATRHAKHLMYQTTKENQAVTFTTSLEGLLCRPGDLIIIEDDLKSLTNNFGKVLDVDPVQGKIKVSESYENTSLLEDKITLYIPTGRQTASDLEDLASIKRNRFLEFSINSDNSDFISKKLNGQYGFAYYSEGFNDTSERYKKEEYALYTGSEDGINHFLWYSTTYTGWVFSTGKSFQHDSTYDKYISRLSGSDGIYHQNLNKFNNSATPWYRFDENELDGRDEILSLDLQNDFYDLSITNGAVDSDIRVNETKQILDFNIISSSNDDYGSTWTIDSNDDNYNLLPLVPEGSIYRVKRKNTDDKIFKVVGIQEIEVNKYQIAANKYISGKYKEMEEYSYKEIEETNSPYDVDSYTSEGRTFVKLNTPANFSVSKTVSKITDELGAQVTRVSFPASWTEVPDATGYSLEVRSSALGQPQQLSAVGNSTVVRGIDENGGYIVSVTALGPSYDANNPSISLLSSDPKTQFINVDDFEEDLTSDASAIFDIQIN